MVIVIFRPLNDNGYMKKPAPNNRIAEIRKAKGLTQQQVASKVDAHWITISKLERGVMQLTRDWMARLALALDVEETELIIPYLRDEQVAIDGTYQAGRITPHTAPALRTIASPPDHAVGRWIEVVDDSLKPFFVRGDLLRFRIVANESAFALVGRTALVENRETGLFMMGVLERQAYDRPPQRGDTLLIEGPISVDVRAFNGMLHSGLVAHDVYVFDGCHVFWTSPAVIAEPAASPPTI